jgi:hypothetical protein
MDDRLGLCTVSPDEFNRQMRNSAATDGEKTDNKQINIDTVHNLDNNRTDIPCSARLAISIHTTATMGHDFAPMKNDLIIRAAKGMHLGQKTRKQEYGLGRGQLTRNTG